MLINILLYLLCATFRELTF